MAIIQESEVEATGTSKILFAAYVTNTFIFLAVRLLDPVGVAAV